jgi:hypothetical protein
MDTGIFGATNEEAILGLEDDLNKWYQNNPGVHKITGRLTIAREY